VVRENYPVAPDHYNGAGRANAAATMPPATGAVASAAGTVLLGRYELGGLLGRGASAKVYLARDLRTGRSVAIKSFPNPRAASDRPVAIEREAGILRRLRHRHVVRLHEILATRTKVHFVLDLAAGGELLSLVDASGRMTEDLARHYFRQLVCAVRYCHARGVCHRDIKPENLLLDGAGALKVADFGLGAVAGAGGDLLRHTTCGTPAYVAPEILSRKGYDPAKVDIWSCGVVLFVLAAGYLPFNDASLVNMYRKIYAGRFRCPAWFSPALRDLLRRVLHPDPSARADADSIVAHPWFRHGASDEEMGRLMHGGGGDEDEEAWVGAAADEDDAGREPTAFDILSFSPGCDLSALFLGGGWCKERVFVGEAAAGVLGRVEAAGRKGGYRVRKEGKRGVRVVGEEGGVVAKVSVVRLADAVSVVEVVKDDGADAALFWTELLEPAVCVPAGAAALCNV
jgi:carbon catabolite-derepressing protein kinase